MVKATTFLSILLISLIKVSLSDRNDFREHLHGLPILRRLSHSHNHHLHGRDRRPGGNTQSPDPVPPTEPQTPGNSNQEILLIDQRNAAPAPSPPLWEVMDITPVQELKPETGALPSLCPPGDPELQVPLRYFNETGKCYSPGKGDNPCGENMLFYAIPGDQVYGECDCKAVAGCDYRPVIYWPSADRCYHLFEQGPCKSGEWLILGPKSNPVCAKRTCPENTDPNPKKTWFTLGGTCHQLTTQAFCDKATERVHFNKGSIEPKCSETPPTDPPGCGTTRTLIAGAPSLPCGPGQKKTGSGACGTAVAFA